MAAVHRVVVGVSGSLGSLQALRLAADEARARGAALVPVIATSFGLAAVLMFSGCAYLLAIFGFFAVLLPLAPSPARAAA